MKPAFVIPFTTGVLFLFGALSFMYVKWSGAIGWKNRVRLKNAVGFSWFFRSAAEVLRESLLHFRIRKINPRLWYMHMSLAFGWFLLIVVGHLESVYHAGTFFTPPSHAIFFDYFSRGQEETGWIAITFNHLMDLLLLFILSGLALAVLKRFQSRRLGMKKKPRHQLIDRLALAFLWLIFPARLVAEVLNHSFYSGGGFMSGSLGSLLVLPENYSFLSDVAWWIYSFSLGFFFITFPFSRYMHILTEVPHIFLKNAGTLVIADEGIAQFHAHACSSCGICMNTCQLNDSGRAIGQSLNFVRNYRKPWPVKEEQTMNCLMCGRCRLNCPVQVDTAGLRMNERIRHHNLMLSDYSYTEYNRQPLRHGKIAFYGGCMTRITPSITNAMMKIFSECGEDVIWVDEYEPVCCGRPLYFSGQQLAFQEMVKRTRQRILESRPEMIVTPCPICLHTFTQDYRFKIPVLHHSQYLLMMLENGRIRPGKGTARTVYHDPCELGRGLWIYAEPRQLLAGLTSLQNPEFTEGEGLCCGGSVADYELEFAEKQHIAKKTLADLILPDTEQLATSCPLCKKTFQMAGNIPVLDIAEIVSLALDREPVTTENEVEASIAR